MATLSREAKARLLAAVESGQFDPQEFAASLTASTREAVIRELCRLDAAADKKTLESKARLMLKYAVGEIDLQAYTAARIALNC